MSKLIGWTTTKMKKKQGKFTAEKVECIAFTATDGEVIFLPANWTIADLVKQGIQINFQDLEMPHLPKPHFYHPAPKK